MNEGGKITRTVFGNSYKEAEFIKIRAESGNLELSSPKEIAYNGKDGGKKLNDFKKNEGSELKVVKIDGPFNSENKKVQYIDKDVQYSYKVLKFNRTPKKEELKLLKWVIQFDNKTKEKMPNVYGSKIAYFKIPKNAQLDKFTVNAFIKTPTDNVKVSVFVNNIYYRFNPLSYARGKNSSKLNSLYFNRESWGANNPITNSDRSFEEYCLVPKDISKDARDNIAIPKLTNIFFGIAIHHSGNGDLNTMPKVQDDHINGKNKYADVAYHFGIDLSGKVYEGRYIGVKGSHLTKYNTGTIGIVFLADFDHQIWDQDNDMTNSALDSLILLIKALQEQYPNINVLGGHKEWKNNTERTCPGEYGQKFVNDVRVKVGMKSPKETGHG